MSAGRYLPPQQQALGHVASLASGGPLDPALRVTLNFHPDRLTGDHRPLLVASAEDGVYRSQFATSTSSCGLTAHPGGDRWRWESRVFGDTHRAGRHNPQAVKKVWHYLARFGAPSAVAARSS